MAKNGEAASSISVLKHGISETLRNEINAATKKLIEGLDKLGTIQETDLKEFWDQMPSGYNPNDPWDDYIVKIHKIQPKVNLAAQLSAQLADHAERLFESLKGEAGVSGCADYYAHLNVKADKITEQMRANYAIQQPEIAKYSEALARATSLKWYYINEHAALVSSAKNFTRYALKASGGY